MRVNKQFRIKPSSLVRLGLMEEGEQYDVEKHRIKTMEYRAKKVISDAFTYENFIFSGFSQSSNEAIFVLKVGTPVQLTTVEGKSVVIKATEFGFEGVSDSDHIFNEEHYHSLKMFVPLLAPTT